VKGDANGAKAGGGGDGKTKKIAAIQAEQLFQQTSSEHGLILHRQKFSTVQIIGRVLSMEESTTKCTYTLQDHTGPTFEVQLWSAGDSSSPQIVVGQYVRVIGQCRKNNTGTNILAYHIKPIDDGNEITLHLIETLFSAMVCHKRKNNVIAQAPIVAGFPPVNPTPQILQGQPMNQGPAMANASQGNAGGVSGMSSGFALVLKAIQGCKNSQGIEIGELCSALKSMPRDQVRKAVEFLSTEGHIYTTIDDDHLKATDG